MLQKNYALNESQPSAIHSTFDESDYAAPAKVTDAIHLNTTLTIYAMIEFLAVASSAYFGSTVYHFVSRHFVANDSCIHSRRRSHCNVGVAIIDRVPQLLCLSKTASTHFSLERCWSGRACVLSFRNNSFFHAVRRSLFTR